MTLDAWVGLLETHKQLTRALDAELDARHGLSLSGVELLGGSRQPTTGSCGCRRSPPSPACRCRACRASSTSSSGAASSSAASATRTRGR